MSAGRFFLRVGRLCPGRRLCPGSRLCLGGIAAASLLGACNSSECTDNRNSMPLAGFYSSAPHPKAIALDSISIEGIGAPGNVLLQDSVKGLSEVSLPFRLDQESTVYEIRYLSGEAGKARISDRITFNYEIKPWFTSAECGVVYQYVMKSIETTRNFIDSVTCPAGIITNAPKQNIRIYFRVAEEEEETE